MEHLTGCWYEDSLADFLKPWVDEMSVEPLSLEMLRRLEKAEVIHSNCDIPEHCSLTEVIRTNLVKDFMSKVLLATTDAVDASALLRFMVKEEGCLILQCLLKFGTKTLGSLDDLFYLLWYILKLKRSTEINLFTLVEINVVCSVCVQLIADICKTEAQSNRLKLSNESLTEFNAFTTNVLLERRMCKSEERLSVDQLMSHTVQAYSAAASLVRDCKVIEDSSVLTILREVASAFHSFTTDERHHSLPSGLEQDTSVLSASIAGLLHVLESVLHKVNSLSHAMSLSADVITLLDHMLCPLIQGLVYSNRYDDVKVIVFTLFRVVKRMKLTKTKYVHNLGCVRKKHRHCETMAGLHHHHQVMLVTRPTGKECGTACVTRLLLNVYQQIPLTTFKMEMVTRLSEDTGCCCMSYSDYINPLIANLPDESEANQHTIMSSLTHVLLHTLSGNLVGGYLGCVLCSPGSALNPDISVGIESIQKMLCSNSKEINIRIVLQQLYTMITLCNSHLVFVLYRTVFKPILDLFYSDRDVVSQDSVRLSLKSLTRAFTQDDCADHFLSSAFGMKILEKCVAEYSTSLPLVLQIFSQLMQLRSEEQVLSPLLKMLLGEPEVKQADTEFVMIELVYHTPDFNEPLSDKHMFLMREKWSCAHRLLHQSALFRSGFQASNGLQFLLTMISDILRNLITNHTLQSTRYAFLSDLFSTLIGCLLICIHHSLLFNKKVFTIETLCTEISTEFRRCDYTVNTKKCIDRSFRILRLLLQASSYKLPAASHESDLLHGRTSDNSVTTSNSMGNDWENSDSASVSSNSEYEADDESYQDGANVTLCSYIDLSQPDLWMLTFELMTCQQLTLTVEQQVILLNDFSKQLRLQDGWKCIRHKIELTEKLLTHYSDVLLHSNSNPLTAILLSLVEYTCHLQITSGLLLQLLTFLKVSQFKENLLRSVHTIITQSRCMPHCSISFPLEKGNTENTMSLIVSQIARYGNKPISALLWLYLDGGISSAYNSSHKYKQPIRLISLVSSHLKITLESEVTNGNICLIIGDDSGNVIDRFRVSSVLTTNKWHMVSFTAEVKTKESLQLHLQYSIGVDGKEAKAGAEPLNTPVKILLDNYSDLDIHIGQGSNLFVKEHTIHFSHAMIFKGRLTEVQCAELYSLGPKFDSFCKCIAEVEPSAVNRRCIMGRRLPPGAVETLFKSQKVSQRQLTMQQILMIIGPKYKPYCLAYNQQPPSVMIEGRPDTVPKTRAGVEEFMLGEDLEQPSAYCKNPSIVYHTTLEEALASLGGVEALLFMYAKCVEVGISEVSQILVLQCLLSASQAQDNFSQAAQQTLDYRLLSKVLASERCLLTPAISRVLIEFAMRSLGGQIYLVDMTFIEQVLLDWPVWESRPASWYSVWCSLCDSVAPANPYKVSNSQALLDSEILQTCIRIPLEQMQKDSSHPMPTNILNKLSLLLHRVLDVSKDKKLIWDISRYLLLLHPAAATFIQYERHSLYMVHHWSPVRKRFASKGQGLGRLRSSDTYAYEMFEDSTEASGTEQLDFINEEYVTDEGQSDYSTDTPAITSDSEPILHTSISTPANTANMPASTPANTANMPASTPANTHVSTACDVPADGRGSNSDTLPALSSPKFADVQCPPDIITAHDDLSGSSESSNSPDTIENSLTLMSSHLLHTLLLICSTELTPTDQQIFCSDLITLDSLTVFLNHDNVGVVYAALKLLSKMMELSSDDQVAGFIKRKGFHLIASQLNQVVSSHKLLVVCAQFVNGQRCSSVEVEDMSCSFMLPLLGTLEQCCHDLVLAAKAFSLVFQVLEERANWLPFAIRNGLIEVLCNCLSTINRCHPEADFELLDNVFVYLHSILQMIASYLVKQEMKVKPIRSLVYMFMVLERKERHNKSGYLAIERVSTVIRIIFKELYSTIQVEAKSMTASFLRRMFSRSSNSTGTLEEPSVLGTSRKGSLHSLSTSMSSLHSLQQTAVESKNSRSTLTDMLLFTLRDFTAYAICRVESCRCDEDNLPNVTELLLNALVVSGDSSKKTTWQFIVESDSVRKVIWKQLADVLTYILSSSCDLVTAENVISVIGQLSDVTQKKIVDSIQLLADDLLLLNLKNFLQTNSIKAVSESFLTRLLRRLALSSTKSSVGANHLSGDPETTLREVWLTHIKKHRSSWKEQLTECKHLIFHNLDSLAKLVSHSATEINKDVVHRQNLERKKFIELVKINMATEVSVSTSWQRLVRQLTHERALWHDKLSYPQSWEIDPTEGPGRVRKRLQRCHMTSIQAKFLLDEAQYKVGLSQSSPPLQYLFEVGTQSESASAALIYRLHTNETIRFTCKCSNVTPSTETVGDILISDHSIHFVANSAISDYDSEVLAGSHELLSIRWPLIEIKSFYKRRYQLQDNGLEIFLTNGRTSLIAVDSTKERDVLWDELSKLHLPNKMTSADLNSIQKQWVNGQMSNFDYLTHLNTLAGRSFNDLMQYPVFPFILNQYEGNYLDLNDPQSYRKLNKPIACQHIENEAKFKQHYEAIEADIELSKRNPDDSHVPLAPYHYASHYSNSGVVLHYLVRLLPYTKMFLRYQDGQFDIPDRTFHSMQTSWLLSSQRSSTDVKELIPEFFYLPEFMTNYEGFNFGKRHTKEPVMDLNLPAWCHHNSRLFVLILRQSLENQLVSTHLHSWINLVFGFQQQGIAAKEAVNIFHPATYYGLEVNSIEDELQQSAIKVMIRTYGQMPKQLFTTKHPEQQQDGSGSSMEHRLACDTPVLNTVSGLCWGDYVGSPSETVDPKIVVNDLVGAATIAAISTGEIVGLAASSCVITHETKTGDELSARTDCIWAARLCWGNSDNVLRLQIQKDMQPINFVSLPFKVTACASLADCRLLLIASDTGFIQVHRLSYSKQQSCEISWVSLVTTLTAHHSAITSLVVSPEYSIIVSADKSGLCVIWDLNKLMYVRCMESETQREVTCVTVSSTMGDIAFCSPHGRGSVIDVYTVNASPISSLTLRDRVNWLCYSSAPEGKSVNVLVGALSNGTLQLWSSWDLRPLRTLSVPGLSEPFMCCTYAQDSQYLAACTYSGRLIIWAKGGPPSTLFSRVKYFPA